METSHLLAHASTLMQPSHARSRSSWVEVDLAAFDHNISLYAQLNRPARFAPVIKSNAYGHGLELIAQRCDQHPQVDYICVVSLSEAVRLRAIGIIKPILVLSILDGSLEDAVIHTIDVVAYNLADVQTLSWYAARHGKQASVHIKIDTGLSRLGLCIDSAYAFVCAVAEISHVLLTGIFTHCAFSESADQTYTNVQMDRFHTLLDRFAQKGIAIPLRHASCSAAATVAHRELYTMIRAGIGIYGLWPSEDNRAMTLAQHPNFSLKPVMTWKAHVLQVKEVPAGTPVGYDLTFRTQRTSQLAIISVGYWDGFDRRFSNNGIVMVHQHRVPIVGIVAMNMAIIDVTGLSVREGDEVTLLGNYDGIRAEDLADRCDTINYEIVTRINPIIARIAIP